MPMSRPAAGSAMNARRSMCGTSGLAAPKMTAVPSAIAAASGIVHRKSTRSGWENAGSWRGSSA